MAKYITSNQICETFDITKMTLWRWETMTPWGVPFPAPAFPPTRGSGSWRHTPFRKSLHLI